MSSKNILSSTKGAIQSSLKISDVNHSRQTLPHSHRFASSSKIYNKDQEIQKQSNILSKIVVENENGQNNKVQTNLQQNNGAPQTKQNICEGTQVKQRQDQYSTVININQLGAQQIKPNSSNYSIMQNQTGAGQNIFGQEQEKKKREIGNSFNQIQNTKNLNKIRELTQKIAIFESQRINYIANQQVNKYKQQRKKIQNQNLKLTIKIAQLEKQINQKKNLSEQRQFQVSKIEQLPQQSSEMGKKQQKQVLDIQQLPQQSSEMSEKQQKQVLDIQQLTEQLSEMGKKQQKQVLDIQQLPQQSSEMSEKQQKQVLDIQQLTEQLSEMGKNYQNQSSQLSRVNQQIVKQKEQIQNLSQKVTRYQEQKKQLKKYKQTLDQQLKRSIQNYQKLQIDRKKVIQDKNKQILVLKSQIQTYKLTLTEINQKYDKLNINMQQEKRLNQALKIQSNSHRQNSQKFQAEIKQLNGQIQKNKLKYDSQLLKVNQQLNGKINQYQNKAQKQFNQLKNKIQQQTQQFQLCINNEQQDFAKQLLKSENLQKKKVTQLEGQISSLKYSEAQLKQKIQQEQIAKQKELKLFDDFKKQESSIRLELQSKCSLKIKLIQSENSQKIKGYQKKIKINEDSHKNIISQKQKEIIQKDKTIQQKTSYIQESTTFYDQQCKQKVANSEKQRQALINKYNHAFYRSTENIYSLTQTIQKYRANIQHSSIFYNDQIKNQALKLQQLKRKAVYPIIQALIQKINYQINQKVRMTQKYIQEFTIAQSEIVNLYICSGELKSTVQQNQNTIQKLNQVINIQNQQYLELHQSQEKIVKQMNKMSEQRVAQYQKQMEKKIELLKRENLNLKEDIQMNQEKSALMNSINNKIKQEYLQTIKCLTNERQQSEQNWNNTLKQKNGQIDKLEQQIKFKQANIAQLILEKQDYMRQLEEANQQISGISNLIFPSLQVCKSDSLSDIVEFINSLAANPKGSQLLLLIRTFYNKISQITCAKESQQFKNGQMVEELEKYQQNQLQMSNQLNKLKLNEIDLIQKERKTKELYQNKLKQLMQTTAISLQEKDSQLQGLERQNAVMKEQINKLSLKIQKLNQQRVETSSKNYGVNDQIQKRIEQNKRLQAELQKQKEELSLNYNAINALKKQLAKKDQQIRQAQTNQIQSKTQFQRENGKINQLVEQNKKLQKNISTSQKNLEKSQIELEKAQYDLAISNSRSQQLNKKVNQLQANIGKLNQNNNQIQNLKNKLISEKNQLTQKVSLLQSKSALMERSRIGYTSPVKDNYKEKYDLLIKQNQQLLKKYSDCENKCLLYKKQSEEKFEREGNNLRKQLNQMKNKYQSLKREKESLNGQSRGMNNEELQEKDQKIEELQSQLNIQKAEYKNLLTNNKLLEEEVKNLRRRTMVSPPNKKI